MSIERVITGLREEGHDYNFNHLAVLLHLRRAKRGDECRLIARTLGLSKPTIVRAADKLGADGLLNRNGVPGDARRCVYALTPAGMELATRIAKGWGA